MGTLSRRMRALLQGVVVAFRVARLSGTDLASLLARSRQRGLQESDLVQLGLMQQRRGRNFPRQLAGGLIELAAERIRGSLLPS